MTWTVMQRALANGCDTFDLMGLGDFKTKFGAELDNRKYRWIRSRYRWLAGMRDIAAKGLHWQQAVRGRVARWGLNHRLDPITTLQEPSQMSGELRLL
jgi:hypothetical protein